MRCLVFVCEPLAGDYWDLIDPQFFLFFSRKRSVRSRDGPTEGGRAAARAEVDNGARDNPEKLGGVLRVPEAKPLQTQRRYREKKVQGDLLQGRLVPDYTRYRPPVARSQNPRWQLQAALLRGYWDFWIRARALQELPHVRCVQGGRLDKMQEHRGDGCAGEIFEIHSKSGSTTEVAFTRQALAKEGLKLARAAQPGDFVGVEVDSVQEPYMIGQITSKLQVWSGPTDRQFMGTMEASASPPPEQLVPGLSLLRCIGPGT